ncbi:MAG: hypothetical protein ACRDRI_23455 [Pseudonocardiaceae bacterium]
MTNDLPRPRWDNNRRRVIPETGAPHRGPVDFTILVVSTPSGQIDLDPHATGTRTVTPNTVTPNTVTLDEDGARVLRAALIGWLR